MIPSEEISSENKRLASRRAHHGSGAAKDPGSSGKTPLKPSGKPGDKVANRRRRRSSLAAYLQHEVSVHVGSPDAERIPPPTADTSRKRRARGSSSAAKEENDEEKRAGEEAARRLGFSKGGGDGDGRIPAERGQAYSSEDESMTLPGLSGVLVTQLTWGSGAWDSALPDSAGDGASATGIDSSERREGLVGTTTLVDISGNTGKPDGRAGRSGGVGLEEERASDREATGRRLTFTEVRASPGNKP